MDTLPTTIQDGLQRPVLEEALQPTAIETISIPNGPIVMQVKDILDGEHVPVVLPRLTEEAAEILDAMYPNGWGEKAINPNGREITRYEYCTNVLRMPPQYAAFLAFGTNYNVDSNYFPIPDNNTKTPLTVAMRGESASEKGGKGVGKSTLTAVLAARLTEKGLSVLVFDFEPFYEEGASLYLKVLHESGWDGSYKDAVTIINSLVWQGGTLKKPGRLKSVREIMEGDATGQGVKYFRNNATRPDVILFDMPGVPGVEKGAQGEVISSRREQNVYDLFGLGADVVFHTNRPVLPSSKYSNVEPIEHKLADFQGVVMDKLKGK